MSLATKLNEIRDGAVKRIPADKLALMQRATAELRGSGIMERVIKVGDPLPSFALTGARAQSVRSSALLAQGAIVLTVFRGHW